MHLTDRNEMTDEQLVQKCKLRDAIAQRQLYEKFAKRMFGVCLRYADGREGAEDLLQESFVKVFEKISSFKGEGSLEGWIRKIVVNTSLDHLRQQKLTWSNQEIKEEQHPTSEDTISRLETQELLKLIQELPKGFRTVFNLYAIEGYHHKEIGELLNISENTSKSQYARARAQLTEKVNALYSNQQSITANP